MVGADEVRISRTVLGEPGVRFPRATRQPSAALADVQRLASRAARLEYGDVEPPAMVVKGKSVVNPKRYSTLALSWEQDIQSSGLSCSHRGSLAADRPAPHLRVSRSDFSVT